MAAMNLRLLEEKFTTLEQRVNGLSMTVDSHWATTQADLLKLKQEVNVWFTSQRTAPAAESNPFAAKNNERHEFPPEEEAANGGWRISRDEFAAFCKTVTPDFEGEYGNMKVAKRLTKALDRSTGPYEGQLYINWRRKAPIEVVRELWKKKGFDSIPEGL